MSMPAMAAGNKPTAENIENPPVTFTGKLKLGKPPASASRRRTAFLRVSDEKKTFLGFGFSQTALQQIVDKEKIGP